MSRRHASPRGVTRRRIAWAIIAAALIVFVVAFDWTWFKPAVQRYVFEHAQRRIDFDRLHVGLTGRLQPTVRFEGITISNAAWADTDAPLIHAGDMQFIFAWRTLIDHRTIVSRLILRDAQIDLERQSDGHRNWRLGNPEDTGPGKVRILALEAERSSLRFLHRGIALDVASRIDPLTTDTAPASKNALPVSQRIAFHGTRQGLPFDGHADVGDVLTFYDTGVPFALRGEATSASLRLTVDGRIADIAMLGSADAQVRLSGTRLADLAFFWSGAEAAAAIAPVAYSVTGHWQTSGDHTAIESLQVQLGSSALTGEIGYRRAGERRPRPQVHADLHGTLVDVVALDKLMQPAHPKPSSAEKPSAGRGMNTASLKRFDADLQVAIDRLDLPHLGAADKFRLSAVLNDGRLDVDPLRLDLAGGQVSGSAHLLPKERGTSVNLRLTLAHLDLARLLTSLPDADRLTGRLDAHATLEAQGASIADWRSSASGDASLSLRDATIADRLEAKLALSGGAILRTLVTTHATVPLRCAAITLAVHDGIVSAQRMGLATDRLALVGKGTLDLRSDALDLLLTPHRKQSAVLALDRSIKVEGSVAKPKISLVDRVDLPMAQGCEAVAAAETPATGK